MNEDICKLVEEKSRDLAKQHAEIIDRECKNVCDKYKCSPSDLILTYIDNLEIKIELKVSHFTIQNIFTVDGKEIKTITSNFGPI